MKKAGVSEAENKNFVCYIDNDLFLKYKEEYVAEENARDLMEGQGQSEAESGVKSENLD